MRVHMGIAPHPYILTGPLMQPPAPLGLCFVCARDGYLVSVCWLRADTGQERRWPWHNVSAFLLPDSSEAQAAKVRGAERVCFLCF